MSDATEILMGHLQLAIAGAMPDALEPLAEAIRRRVSVPVDYSTTPETRSKPGEPPRKDTGDLQASVGVSVAESSDRVQGVISVEVPYAKPLNDERDRPIAGDEPDRHLSGAIDALARSLSN